MTEERQEGEEEMLLAYMREREREREREVDRERETK